jgi:hypothetical protein
LINPEWEGLVLTDFNWANWLASHTFDIPEPEGKIECAWGPRSRLQHNAHGHAVQEYRTILLRCANDTWLLAQHVVQVGSGIVGPTVLREILADSAKHWLRENGYRTLPPQNASTEKRLVS